MGGGGRGPGGGVCVWCINMCIYASICVCAYVRVYMWGCYLGQVPQVECVVGLGRRGQELCGDGGGG